MKKWTLVLVFALTLGAVLYGRSPSVNMHNAQMALARETRKAMDAMMGDFREARSATIEGVPADGKWYHSLAFDKGTQGAVRYELTPAGHELRRVTPGSSRTVAVHIAVLNIRRQPGVADVLEVQLQAQNSGTLISNFKIRTRN